MKPPIEPDRNSPTPKYGRKFSFSQSLSLLPPCQFQLPDLATMEPVNREYHKWLSPALGREMELLVFEHAGPPALAFSTSCGRFFDFENCSMVTW
jgi:hypothetical protein